MMQVFTGMGRVVAEPKLFGDKKNVIHVRLAFVHTRGKKKESGGYEKDLSFFVKAKAFSHEGFDKAGFLAKELAVGDRLVVKGRLLTETWEDDEGETHYESVLHLDEFQLVESRKTKREEEAPRKKKKASRGEDAPTPEELEAASSCEDDIAF